MRRLEAELRAAFSILSASGSYSRRTQASNFWQFKTATGSPSTGTMPMPNWRKQSPRNALHAGSMWTLAVLAVIFPAMGAPVLLVMAPSGLQSIWERKTLFLCLLRLLGSVLPAWGGRARCRPRLQLHHALHRARDSRPRRS